MQITVISDTHGAHEELGRLSGDVLVHCGDMFNMFSGGSDDFERMDDWFGSLDFSVILCVGGNHDFELEKRARYTDEPFRNATFLHDRSIDYDGVTFYGSSWVPDLLGQAFFASYDDLPQHWAKIPDKVDVLVTHTPPATVMDVSSSGLKLGCDHLRSALHRVRPSLHCFGHVHASSGECEIDGTRYVNAALVNSQYELARSPYTIEL